MARKYRATHCMALDKRNDNGFLVDFNIFAYLYFLKRKSIIMIKFGSVCSGMEAASVAWKSLGWEAQWFCEFEAFPSAILKHRFPGIPNLGDMTKIYERKEYNDRSIDLLVGGTPCQSFSVAGLRKGLDDERGNLALEFCRILLQKQPRWFVWENVPGVLSSNGGQDFGSILGAMAECGYGFAYRILDAQNFGVPQRRRRVFVVGYLGDWRPPAAVLFEQNSLQGDFAGRRKKGEEAASYTPSSFGKYSEGVGTLRAEGGDIGGGSETLVVHGTQDPDCKIEQAHTLGRNGGRENAITYPIHDKATRHNGGGDSRSNDGSGNGLGIGRENAPMNTLTAGDKHAVAYSAGNNIIRRLTPIECERLQGFPDNWTQIPWRGKSLEDCPDGLRYKACGNSMAVPVMRWIGERIELFKSVKMADNL